MLSLLCLLFSMIQNAISTSYSIFLNRVSLYPTGFIGSDHLLGTPTSNGFVMPTPNEVDSRPVAVGKWPRQRFHRQPAQYGQTAESARQKFVSGNNNGDNCVHKYENICLDVLLRPELLHEIYGDRGMQ